MRTPVSPLGTRTGNWFDLAGLEPRLMMCADDHPRARVAADLPDLCLSPAIHEVQDVLNLDAGPSAVASTDPLTLAATAELSSSSTSSIPALSSNPGAADTIYLDFDGHFESTWGSYRNITTPAFDTDGDPATFSGTEQGAIEQIWRYVAEDYAPFDVNVTTVEPASFANGVGLRVSIGGDGAWIGKPGGVAYVDSYTNFIANTVFVFPRNLANGYARYVGEASSHEAGHAFGLQHQSVYSGTTRTSEYNAGTGDGRAPIMGSSYGAARGLWWRGPSSISSTSIQDDMAIISKPTNFGYRADDHGNAPATATAMAFDTDGQSRQTGLIAQVTDVDYFSFTTGAGGAASFSLDVAAGYANLDSRLELRRSDGALLASAAPSTSFGAALSTTLTPGTYYLVAASHGGYGDVGTYSIGASIEPEAPVEPLDAPAELEAVAVSDSQVRLSWADHSGSAEDGFLIERSRDGGASWDQVGVAARDAVAWSDTSVVAGSSYTYRVIAYRGVENSEESNLAPVTLRPGAPGGLSATAASASQINLAWADVNGETGYTIQRSTSGTGGWTTVGSTAAGITAFQSAGLASNTLYYYRVVASNAGGTSAASPSASARTLSVPTAPAAPSGLTATVVSSRRIDLRWTDNASNEQGFRIYRSTNGGRSWSQVGSVGQNATTWSDTRTSRRTTYTYRIRAFNNVGNSSYSNSTSATTPRSSSSIFRLFSVREVAGGHVSAWEELQRAFRP